MWADTCRVLDRGMDGKKLDEPSQSAYDASDQDFEPATKMLPIAGPWQTFKGDWSSGVNEMRSLDLKNDKETIATWKLDLDRVL